MYDIWIEALDCVPTQTGLPTRRPFENTVNLNWNFLYLL